MPEWSRKPKSLYEYTAEEVEQLALATLRHKPGHARRDGGPKALPPPTSLPPLLRRRPRPDYITALEDLDNAFSPAVAHGTPLKPTRATRIAVLAAAIDTCHRRHAAREAALDVFSKARIEVMQVENARSRLSIENKTLTKRIQEERDRRTRAVDRKTRLETRLEQRKRDLEVHRIRAARFRESLDAEKLADLDIRRKLDRTRLKVAALRGEMIIPTVDKISPLTTKWLGEFDHSIVTTESDTKADAGKAEDEKAEHAEVAGVAGVAEVVKKDAEDTGDAAEGGDMEDRAHANDGDDRQDGEEANEAGDAATSPSAKRKRDVEMETIVAGDDVDSGTLSGKDELEMDDSGEEMEFRLLKNRLAMCESEAKEWKECVESERQRVRLILRSKSRLEEELARQKHSGVNKSVASGGARGAAKSIAGSARATAKLRAAVRASLPSPVETGVQQRLRRTRKGRPRKALVPEIG